MCGAGRNEARDSIAPRRHSDPIHRLSDIARDLYQVALESATKKSEPER